MKTRRSVDGPASKKLRYELDWNRSVYVDGDIDDALVRRLAPQIMGLKRDSSEPITVGIDSAGGSVRSLVALLGLLESPDQRGRRCPYYSVAMNRAQSAAASLLAFGEYSVAFNHSQILFHPHSGQAVSGLSASDAISMARDLKREDEDLASTLAERILKRHFLIFSDLRERGRFVKAQERFPAKAARFRALVARALGLVGCQEPGIFEIDFAGLAMALWEELQPPLDRRLIDVALIDLVRILEFREIAMHLRTLPAAGRKARGRGLTHKGTALIRAYEYASTLVGGAGDESRSPGRVEQRLGELERVMAVFLRRAADDEDWDLTDGGFRDLEDDYMLFERFGDCRAPESAQEVLWENVQRTLSDEAIEALESSPEDEQSLSIRTLLEPQMNLLWLFYVTVCRRLIADENVVHPRNAQVLGLVDQVLGGGAVRSRAEAELMAATDARGASPGEGHSE